LTASEAASPNRRDKAMVRDIEGIMAPPDHHLPATLKPGALNRLVPFCMFTDPELARVDATSPRRGAMELNTVWRRCRWPLCSARERFPNRAAS
jgi:hypothetical protein